MASQLDKIDRELILLLQEDSRTPTVQLARQLGISRSNVSRRMKRLIKEQVIQLGVMTDPFKVGFETFALIQFQTKHGTAERVAEKLADFDNFFFVTVTTGRFDVTCAALFRSEKELANCVLNQLETLLDVERIETILVLKMVKRTYRTGVPAK